MKHLYTVLLIVVCSTIVLSSNLSAYEFRTRQKEDGSYVTEMHTSSIHNAPPFFIILLVLGTVFVIVYFMLKLLFQSNSYRGFWELETAGDGVIYAISILLAIFSAIWFGGIMK